MLSRAFRLIRQQRPRRYALEHTNATNGVVIMRNGVPPRRRNHPSHPASCEVLESRILLSSADDAIGLVVPTYHSSNGHVEATTYDRTTGLDTRFSLSFQRDMDFTKPATFDVYIIDIQLLDHITH